MYVRYLCVVPTGIAKDVRALRGLHGISFAFLRLRRNAFLRNVHLFRHDLNVVVRTFLLLTCAAMGLLCLIVRLRAILINLPLDGLRARFYLLTTATLQRRRGKRERSRRPQVRTVRQDGFLASVARQGFQRGLTPFCPGLQFLFLRLANGVIRVEDQRRPILRKREGRDR